MTKEKNKGGRPTKYKPEYCQEIIDFFSTEPSREVEITNRNKKGEEWTTYKEVANPIPFLSAFARKIGVCHDTLLEWASVHGDFSVAYNKAKALQKEFLIQNGLKGFYPPASFIFTAKNITTMKDKNETEHSGQVNLNMMGTIKIDGKKQNFKVGDDADSD